MEYRIIEQDGKRIVNCLPDGGIISSEADALDVVAICGEEQAPLLLHEDNLPGEFFDLKTGLAGAVLLKLSNYWVKAAAVISPERANQGRFGEFVLETNRRSRDFRVFDEERPAIDWLLQE